MDDKNFKPEFKLEDSDIEFGKCPRCKTETFELEMVDEFTRDALSESNYKLVYASVCTDCLILLKDNISHVGRLRAEKRERLSHLLAKWKNKIEVLKTGRTLMSQNIYSEAQKYFEDYISILETVYNNGEEGLTPNLIPPAHRRQEATLLVGLLCDLIFIYDKFEQGTAKLKNTCDMLVLFLPLCRGQGTLLRKIKKLQEHSKNKDILANLFTDAKNKKSGCYIATAVFDDNDAIELSILRNFRDSFLRKTQIGRKFIFFYYRYSPYWASKFKKNIFIKKILQKLLITFCYIIDPFL